MTPDTCSAPTSAHDGRDPQPYVVMLAGSATGTTVLCRGCAERVAEAGVELFVERRQPPYQRPAWPRLRRAAA